MLIKERLRILGVDCPACVYAIGRNISKLNGIREFNADATTGNAIIEFDDEKTSLRDIYEAIRDAGYDVEKEVINVSLDIAPEETSVIEEKVLKFNGVFDISVNPVSKTAKIIYNPLMTNSGEILGRMPQIGIIYSEVKGVKTERKVLDLLYRRMPAFFLGLMAIGLGTGGMLFGLHSEETLFILLGISLIVIALSVDILAKGLKALIFLRPTMESLISLSSLSTFTSGVLFLITRLYNTTDISSLFEASAGILGFIGLGLYLEERLRRRALAYLSELEESFYGNVRVVKNSSIQEISIQEIRVGDVVEVKAGDSVPVDGVVVDGWGYLDESAFTGEPTPVLKRSDTRDPVLAGSKLVSGYLRIRATRIGEETSLSHLLESAKNAVFYKPSFQRFADRIVGYLTWIVIAVALSTFIIWWLITRDLVLSLTFTASVLAVTCPCPLGIAIPLAVSIGVIIASKKGVLVRKGDVFERMTKTNTIVFDKTGTLTIGRPRVIEFKVSSDLDGKKLLEYVCSIEARSEHVLAQALLEYCNEQKINKVNPEHFEHFPGLGVTGKVNGISVVIGNLKFLEDMRIDMPKEMLRYIDEIGSRGGTPVLIAINGVLAGVFEVRDALREEAFEVVDYFKRLGFRIGIASGDTESSVEFIKKKLGLDFAYSFMRPIDKARLIKELQSSGSHLIYVGDGVNDVSALSAAFLGIAMGKAAEISREAGDGVLVSNNLKGLIDVHRISSKVVRIAKSNLAWAFVYNTALVPVAAGVLYLFTGILLRPEMAALAMVFSDISVILNSSRLLISAKLA